MSRAATYRSKHKELTDLQKRYHEFLTSRDREAITMQESLKLINEIARLDRQIKSIENMNMRQLREPVTEWEIEMPGRINWKL